MDNYPIIHSIKLTNFKGISELDLSLDKSLTLIAGRNGVGKTTIIEAIIASCSSTWDWYFETSSGYNLPWPIANIVRVGSDIAQSELCLSSPLGEVIAAPLTSIKGGLNFHMKDARKLTNKRWSITPLPIISYGQDRTGRDESSNRYGSKDNSLDAGLHSISEFKKWFFEKEGDEGREVKERRDLDYSDSELDVIRHILGGMEGLDSIRSRLDFDGSQRILHVTKHGLSVPFDSLSSGEKAFFILAIDLARRLIITYPGAPLSECRAIVCIDEIELHLHPTWQRRIIGQLLDTFPACQFIVSTHSPQVIGGVRAKHIRLLTQDMDGVVNVKIPAATKGRDSNYILEALLDATERDVEINRLFLDFEDLLYERDFGDAEKVLEQLDALVEGGSSRIAAKRAKLRRKKGEHQ